MTNPDGEDSTTPRNTSEAPSGEGPSGTTSSPPALGQEPETLSPCVAGLNVRPSRQSVFGGTPPTPVFSGHGGVGDTAVGESSGGGGDGVGVGGVSAGMATLQISASGDGGSGGVVQRKRTREGGDAGAGSSGGQVRGGGPPLGGFRCYVCGRDDFCNHHSLGGHMRTHPERPWKCVFPPPVFSRDEFSDVLGMVSGSAPAVGGGQAAEVAVAVAVADAGGADKQEEVAEGEDRWDLNALPTAEEERSPPKEEEPSSSTSSTKLIQDLNKPPLPED